jgi:hypothetical protein
MEIVWSALGLILLGGLPVCLWLVVRRSRRRTARVAAQRVAPIVPATSPVTVWQNRKANAALAIFFAYLLAGFSRSVLVDGSWLSGVFALLFAAMVVFFGRHALQRAPALVIDGDGLTIGKSRRRVCWDQVEQLRVCEGRFLNAVNDHSLECEIRPATADRPTTRSRESISIQLNWLSMSWNDILQAIEQRCGHRVPVEQE